MNFSCQAGSYSKGIETFRAYYPTSVSACINWSEYSILYVWKGSTKFSHPKNSFSDICTILSRVLKLFSNVKLTLILLKSRHTACVIFAWPRLSRSNNKLKYSVWLPSILLTCISSLSSTFYCGTSSSSTQSSACRSATTSSEVSIPIASPRSRLHFLSARATTLSETSQPPKNSFKFATASANSSSPI